IIDLLVKIQVLDERQHDAVMSRSRSPSGGHVVQQVAEMGYATEATVARAVSVELGLPRIDLAMTPPEGPALALLDARTCADKFVLPVALRENGELLWLAMADPTDEDAIGLVRRKAQKRVRPAVAGPTELLRAVRALYAAPGAGGAAVGAGKGRAGAADGRGAVRGKGSAHARRGEEAQAADGAGQTFVTSRWVIFTLARCFSVNLRPSSSASATLRCRPPVQPM